jgi:predicted enzyme related to lactoylglutathione lyase
MARLKFGYLRTQDITRSVSFYSQILGFRLKFQDGQKWAQFDANGADFALGSPEESAQAAGGGAVLVFEVEDLGAAALRIAEAGGTVNERRDMGSHGQALLFSDPDGNLVQLYAKAGPRG